jgi:hypothetical protein
MQVSPTPPIRDTKVVTETATAINRSNYLPQAPSWMNQETVIVIGGAVVVALFIYFLKKSSQTAPVAPPSNLNPAVSQLVATNPASQGLQEMRHNVKSFISTLWPNLDLDACCQTPQTGMDRLLQHFTHREQKNELQQFLENKLLAVLKHAAQPNELKIAICIRVIENFTTYLNHAIANVKNDIAHDPLFRATFGIDSRETIVSVTMSGQETHNGGHAPLFITLSSGTKIVYKPRSLISEQLLCGANNSLFARWNPPLPTYKIYNKADQNYGYTEFLVNLKRENTFNTPHDPRLDDYAKAFLRMDRIGRELGLSDIHADNVLTASMSPHLIDTEVILVPMGEAYNAADKTGLLHGGAAGYKFYPILDDVKNKIWIKDEQGNEIRAQAEGEEPVLSILTDKLIEYQAEIEKLTGEEEHQIDLLKEQLMPFPHRIVVIGTSILTSLIRKPLEEAKIEFLEDLQEGLLSWGFQATAGGLEIARNHFETDLRNHDVPIFYFKPQTGEILYHQEVIARKIS